MTALLELFIGLVDALIQPDEKKRIAALKKLRAQAMKARDQRMGRT